MDWPSHLGKLDLILTFGAKYARQETGAKTALHRIASAALMVLSFALQIIFHSTKNFLLVLTLPLFFSFSSKMFSLFMSYVLPVKLLTCFGEVPRCNWQIYSCFSFFFSCHTCQENALWTQGNDFPLCLLAQRIPCTLSLFLTKCSKSSCMSGRGLK